MKVKPIIGIFCFWALFLTGVAHAHTCVDNFLPVHQGELVPLADLPFVEGASEARLLGEGAFGKVYRVSWPHQRSSVFKVYSHGSTARIDQTRLEKLRTLVSLGPPHHFQFRVVESRLITDTVMELENIEGTSLADLIHSTSGLSWGIKEKLYRSYYEALNNLDLTLSSRYRQVQISKAGLIELVKYDFDEEKKFYLKADNIIVTSDLEFWVADPY